VKRLAGRRGVRGPCGCAGKILTSRAEAPLPTE
jgi:hypothetical protein